MEQALHHINTSDWLEAPGGDPRGYIQGDELSELWFHTGTICNLSCPFCLEGSKPGDDRLNRITLEDAIPFVDEAVGMGVTQFSFTGGEPFVVKDIVKILEYALQFRPCMVLTNGTDPILKRMDEVLPLLKAEHPLSFRISIDFPTSGKHDDGRGDGSFNKSLQAMRRLQEAGFSVSSARHMEKDEDAKTVDETYSHLFAKHDLPEKVNMVAFPDFHAPGSLVDVPHITEDCMTRYHTESSRSTFMCSFSRMLVKQDGKMRVYACTLVDDDKDYDMGGTLAESMRPRVMLKHHRCYSCFALGSSCSES